MATTPDDPDRSPEQGEIRDALLTFVPAIVLAFVLNWALQEHAGFTSRRALATSIGVGIVLALMFQRALARQRGS
jgi:predicted PurR-regulated permease PerM